jgi:hypothetical protein
MKEHNMDIISLFEQLASTAHHNVNLEALLVKESSKIQQAFLNNDATSLKNYLSNNQLLADRNTTFQL